MPDDDDAHKLRGLPPDPPAPRRFNTIAERARQRNTTIDCGVCKCSSSVDPRTRYTIIHTCGWVFAHRGIRTSFETCSRSLTTTTTTSRIERYILYTQIQIQKVCVVWCVASQLAGAVKFSLVFAYGACGRVHKVHSFGWCSEIYMYITVRQTLPVYTRKHPEHGVFSLTSTAMRTWIAEFHHHHSDGRNAQFSPPPLRF